MERTLIEGVVESRNERGIRVNGEWASVSKFRPLELPPQGSTVRMVVDSKGFLYAVDVLEADGTAVTTSLSQPSPRLAVLQAAAAFGASRPDLKSSDVLTIADRWLAWVESANG